MFEDYIYLSRRIINADETLNKYESDLYTKRKHLDNLLINTSFFAKITHPIKLIRTKKEIKRIKKINSFYYQLKNSPLPEHFDEESGELEQDFYNAATNFKPSRMKEFAKRNPIYSERDKKLLKRKR